jgi:hypothetical protein
MFTGPDPLAGADGDAADEAAEAEVAAALVDGLVTVVDELLELQPAAASPRNAMPSTAARRRLDDQEVSTS